MAAPLGLLLAALGGAVGYLVQRRPESASEARSITLGLIVAIPILMGIEFRFSPEPPLFAVHTAVEIDAPPEAVWQQVVAFTPIPDPEEWLFRWGIAYPVRAEIRGAVRRCVFSTGAFEEPIEIWQEARLLKFSVTSNPPPMKELTPYASLHPPHLDNFLVSRRGQFLLERLPRDRTRLEGTTWYHHHLWPAGYWRIWSDFIIHRIHLRVLEHVKRLAELEANRPAFGGP